MADRESTKYKYLKIVGIFVLALIIVGVFSYLHVFGFTSPIKDGFANIKEKDDSNKIYNPVYTDKYKYTNPPGDVEFLKENNIAIGSNGSFLPLQGKGAGFFLSLADEKNMVDVDLIGGDPSIVGFNDFGMNKRGITNSYLLEDGNKRIATPGTDSRVYELDGEKEIDSLPCPKGPQHYVKQDGECILPADLNDLNKVFLYKSLPQWKKV